MDNISLRQPEGLTNLEETVQLDGRFTDGDVEIPGDSWRLTPCRRWMEPRTGRWSKLLVANDGQRLQWKPARDIRVGERTFTGLSQTISWTEDH
jgi:hypothetical protein